MTAAAYTLADSLLFASGSVEILVRGAIFGALVGMAFAVLPSGSAKSSPGHRRHKIAGSVAVVAALGIIVAVLAVDVAAKRRAGDRCVVSAPLEARGFPSSHVEYSPLPGKWTCIYRDPSGRELRRTMSLDVFP